MSSFFPSDPNDKIRTQVEIRDWQQSISEKKKAQKRENIRFWITTILSAIAALAAVAGVLIQLALKQ